MPYDVPIHKEQEYCLGVGMSIYFKILSNPKPGVGDESSGQFLMFHIYCKNTQYNYASDGIMVDSTLIWPPTNMVDQPQIKKI